VEGQTDDEIVRISKSVVGLGLDEDVEALTGVSRRKLDRGAATTRNANATAAMNRAGAAAITGSAIRSARPV